VLDGPYKLLWQPQGGPNGTSHLLFDLRQDPAETRDLLAGESPVGPESKEGAGGGPAALVESLLERARQRVPPFDSGPARKAPIDPELEERLRALGYLE
jgi:hypothetical protein